MAYGQGTIRRTPSGRWKARYWADGKQLSKTFARKTDANDFLAAVQTDKRRGIWIDPRKAETPFGDWAEQWLANKHSLEPSTRSRYQSQLKCHLLPAFGNMALGKISALTVQGWISSMISQKLSPRTIQSCHTQFASIMRSAVASKLIPEAPVGRGVVDLPAVHRKPERFLTHQELELFVEGFKPHFQALIYTAAYTGCRWQEVSGLLRENLDLPGARLHVRTVAQRIGGREILKPFPKTDASYRTISFPDKLGTILDAHLSEMPEAELVFTGPKRGILREPNFRERDWLPAVGKLLPQLSARRQRALAGLTFHDLRHTHVAWLIEAGAQPLVIQRRLGHKSIRTTLDVYGHLFPNAEESVVRDLTRRLEDRAPVVSIARGS